MPSVILRFFRQASTQRRAKVLWVAAVSLNCLLAIPVFSAQEQQPDLREYPFSIASQPLSPALLAFSRTTGISLLVAKSELDNKWSPDLQGSMTAAHALDKILTDTNLGFTFIDRETVSISTSHLPVAPAGTAIDRGPEAESGPEPTAIAVIEETIVSARRRNEQLQKIPLPVTVLTSAQIKVASDLFLACQTHQ